MDFSSATTFNCALSSNDYEAIEVLSIPAPIFCKKMLKEYRLLDRLYYKNKNQHRSSQHLQKTALVRKHFKKFESLRFVPKKTLSSTEQMKLSQNESVKRIMIKVIGGYLIATSVRPAIQEAYHMFRQVAQQTFFIPTCLTFMAILASLSKLFADYIEASHLFYYQLIEKLMENESNLDGLPSSLRSINIHTSSFESTEIDIVESQDYVCELRDTEKPTTESVKNELSDDFFTRIKDDHQICNEDRKPKALEKKFVRVSKQIKTNKRKSVENEIDDIFGDKT